MNNYDKFNREERAICAHLFRLLHENLGKEENTPLKQFIDKILHKIIANENVKLGLTNFKFENIGIYCEVAIIRDAFQYKKPNINPFMDDLTRIIMRQESVDDCRLYSELPKPLNDPRFTHPKQIRQKASSDNIGLTEIELKVFGAMQGMFNAKPDLVIILNNQLLVFEAKFTEPFDEYQLKRTKNITEVWAELLYDDFGFPNPPAYSIIKLGAAKYNPDISWTDILLIAEKTYSQNDRSLIAFKSAVTLLKEHKLE
jgi:hypothetical protein